MQTLTGSLHVISTSRAFRLHPPVPPSQLRDLVRMSGEKRKRSSDDNSGRPHSKKAKAISAENIKVSLLSDVDEWAPILGVCITVWSGQHLLSSESPRFGTIG